jgi:hypothetical protein
LHATNVLHQGLEILAFEHTKMSGQSVVEGSVLVCSEKAGAGNDKATSIESRTTVRRIMDASPCWDRYVGIIDRS